MNTISKLCIYFLMVMYLSSCALWNRDALIGDDGLPAYDTFLLENDDKIASNLIFVLAQLIEFRPVQTTIQLNEPITALGKTIEGRLRDAGYGIQKVKSDQGANYVRYKFEESVTEKGKVLRYSMSVGELVLERDYAIVDNSIVPDSAIYVSGASETDVLMNDDIFIGTGSSYEESVFFENVPSPQITVVSTQEQGITGLIAANRAMKKNLYETRESNFGGVFDSYDDIESDILVFANDSLVMGKKNKNIVQEYVKQMDPETDIISIIGCSHGKSKIKNGNSLLAIGRANRVKEAFVYAGVDYGKVLDEGCWAPHYFDEMMPRRGVVLTLKRLKG